MRILIAYVTTERCEESLKQSFLSSIHFPVPDTEIVVASNKRFGWLQHPQIIEPSIGNWREFNLSRARNLCIDYALRAGHDWVVCMDADGVFIGLTQFPPSGYGSCRIYRTARGERLLDLQLDRPDRWGDSSWFVLSRSVFAKSFVRFDEGYVGYGFEDWDFHESVLGRNGIHASGTDAKAIHFWHPPRAILNPCNAKRFWDRRKGLA